MKKLFALVFLLLLNFPAFGAEGLRALPDSAEAMGMVGGRLAILDDASVTSTNPATLTRLKETQVQFTYQPWHGKTDYFRPGGATDSMVMPWKHTGSAYIVHPLNENTTLGLGIKAPFGVSINWPQEGAFRYIGAYDTKLQTVAFNPAVGIKINDEVSFGFGLDIYRSDLKVEQRFPWALVAMAPVPDGDMEFEGSGWGLGAYFGLNVDLGERHRIAVTGRLPVSIDYEGEFHVSNIPAPGAALPTSPFWSEIEHPGSIGVGYAFEISDRLTFGADFEWLQNSTHDDVPLLIGPNQPLLAGKNAVPLNWDDSVSFGFGFEYECMDGLTLRTGYLYSDSPMNSATYNPSVPADDRHLFSVGVGYSWNERNTIDFAYSLIHMDDSLILGNVQPGYNGLYKYNWDVLTLSYTRKF